MMSRLDIFISFCGLFEAELLVELMLRYWEHPCADDRDSVNYLVEAAADVLSRSKNGVVLFEDISPEDMNFVAAVWYAEFNQVQDLTGDLNLEKRREWLDKIRRSIPSCFCNPDDLT